MGKVGQKSTKYLIKAQMDASGIVEKPDIVGAIFGQTEGLLDEEMDLRELQERGRIGRIDVQVEKEDGSATATIKIPSSLDAADTSILAASLETIERVGPTNAQINVEKIEDRRVSKRDYIVKRAKQLLSDLQSDKPGKDRITEEIKEDVREAQLTEYRGFEAGPKAEESSDVILVEGRADLVKLLKNGVKNVIAIGGTSVPDKLSEAVEDKEVTAFLDGDRGGDLILEELREKIDVEYVIRAPENKEVEELDRKQLFERIRDRKPEKRVEEKEIENQIDDKKKEKLKEMLNNLVGTRATHVLDEDMNVVEKIPRDSLTGNGIDEAHAVVFDGEIDRDIVEELEGKTDYLVGMSRDGYSSSSSMRLLTKDDLN